MTSGIFQNQMALTHIMLGSLIFLFFYKLSFNFAACCNWLGSFQFWNVALKVLQVPVPSLSFNSFFFSFHRLEAFSLPFSCPTTNTFGCCSWRYWLGDERMGGGGCFREKEGGSLRSAKERRKASMYSLASAIGRRREGESESRWKDAVWVSLLILVRVSSNYDKQL